MADSENPYESPKTESQVVLPNLTLALMTIDGQRALVPVTHAIQMYLVPTWKRWILGIMSLAGAVLVVLPAIAPWIVVTGQSIWIKLFGGLVSMLFATLSIFFFVVTVHLLIGLRRRMIWLVDQLLLAIEWLIVAEVAIAAGAAFIHFMIE